MVERYGIQKGKVLGFDAADIIGKKVKILVGSYKGKIVKIEKVEYDAKMKDHRILTKDTNGKIGGAIEIFLPIKVDKENNHCCPHCNAKLSKIHKDKRYFMEDMIKEVK